MAGYVYRGAQRGLTAEEQAEDLIEREQRRCASCGYLARSLGHRVQCQGQDLQPAQSPPGRVLEQAG
jgi:hypothetical protein